MSKVFLGMGIQALCVAGLVALNMIEPTSEQQLLAAIIFFIFALFNRWRSIWARGKNLTVL